MPLFNETINPTAFGFFDADAAFQTEADSMIKFVKGKLGHDVLQVELTKKEIWTCFEEAVCEYGRYIHEMRIKSELSNVLGMPTGSVDLTNQYPRFSLEHLMRQAEPYASYAGVGGTQDSILGYFDIINNKQDYNFYTELKRFDNDQNVWDTLDDGMKGKLRIMEVFHVEPLAAQHYLLNASNITNFLATSFNYESYVNSTVFYVLPVFEDILRRTMLETAHRVRRSNYSYQIIGSNLRVYPLPSAYRLLLGAKLFIRVMPPQNPLNPTSIPGDQTINGVSGPQNIPFGNLIYNTISQPGRQWIRQYTLALCKELLGLIRSKLQTIPIPNAELTLNGDALISQAREDKDKLITNLKEFLENLTRQKLAENDAIMAENINKQLRFIPTPHAISTF